MTVRETLATIENSELGKREDFGFIKRGVSSDAHAWDTEFGFGHDPSKLGVERNILRYVPTQVLVRADESASAAETLRVVLAGLAANAPVALSVGKDLPVDVRGVLENKGIKYEVKSDAQFREYLASNAKTPAAR